MKKTTYIFIIILCLLAPMRAHAGVRDFMSEIEGWWSTRTVGKVFESSAKRSIENDRSYEAPEKTPDSEADDSNDGVKEGGISGMCKVPQEPSVMLCEIGSGFVCIDTPPGSVVSDSMRIRGTMDRRGSVHASIRVAVQNEYTKGIVHVDTTNPEQSGCWDSREHSRPFCMDEEGRFSAEIPLRQNGPYTISLSASRLSGESGERKVRTTRVVAPSEKDWNVTFDPDVDAEKSIDSNMVMVEVDLLGECRFCDFIGASTGGVTVKVTNAMAGGQKGILCKTTVVQGGQARYVIGVPTVPGKNELEVKVCNAATGDECLSMTRPIQFEVVGDTSSLKFISPEAKPSYSSDEYPEIDWKFTLGGSVSCIDMQFNRLSPERICADADGIFSTVLKPRSGINVATLSSENSDEQFAWTFGWGNIVSPYASDENSVEATHALGISMSGKSISDIGIPFINNFFASDEFFQVVVSAITAGLGGEDGEDSSEEAAEEKSLPEGESVSIPGCEEGSLGGMVLGLEGAPDIGGIRLEDFELTGDRADLSVALEGFSITLEIAPDKDGDGVGDKDPLPLFVSFKEAKLVLSLMQDKTDDGTVFLISSPYTDCAYKGDYCKGTPASLVPDNFVGNATPWGNFIKCDVSKAKGDAVKACKAINTINSQIGIVGEMVLDAVNSAIHCSGSQVVSNMMINPVRFPVGIGCADGAECDGIGKIIAPMKLPLGIRLEDDIALEKSYIGADVAISVGDDEFFRNTPSQYHLDSAGFIVGDEKTRADRSYLGTNDLGLSLSFDAINAILFAAFAHGDGNDVRGLFDIDVHEPFFNDLGVDFVEECDAFEPIPGVTDRLPVACYIRPRVMELLGSALTNYGYFPAKQPVIMAFRGNRALGPRIEVTTLNRIPVVPRTTELSGDDGDEDIPDGNLLEVELGGIGLSFYAIEVDENKSEDEYGNLPMKLDSRGNPVIHSMRPEDPNPWNGQIVSFDLTLLLALELSDVMPDEKTGEGYVVKLRTLADRSRLIITPVEGANATTIPSRKLISNLADQLMTALAQFTPKENAISLSIPDHVAFESSSDDGGIFSAVGLKRIDLGPKGLTLGFDESQNRLHLALSAIITQVLHVYGEEITYMLPE